ncbi:phosphoadenosine phosphosulfate reductase [Gammaproteobacteria bacterium]|nr:phosphoadenosine phosphosulfate reductase [Gammaproteobacteria bacterium]
MSTSSAQRLAEPSLPLPSLAEAIRLHATGDGDARRLAVAHCNRLLAGCPAGQRVEWALANLPGEHVLTSSFGAQAAVSLHLVSRLRPGIPVIFIDTGYLFAETYRFVDQLAARLELDLRIYRAALSPAWQEARFGRRWEQGLAGIEAYNRDNKVEPMERALRQLGVGTWFAGLRRSQASTRAGVEILDWSGGERWKVHPIADWSDRDVHRYLEANGLPYHPLWQQGYVSIGDVHSTRPLQEVGHIDETRFNGLKRECGLHEINLSGL